MGWTAAAVVAGSVIGGQAQKSAASKSARANLEQQRRALAFQREMTQKGVEALRAGRTETYAQGLRMMRQSQADIRESAARRGMDQYGSLAMGAQRGALAQGTQAAQQLQYQYARDIAALYGQQEFPMVMQAGPQGNWGADYAKLASAIAGGLNEGGGQGTASTPPAGQSFDDLDQGEAPASDGIA